MILQRYKKTGLCLLMAAELFFLIFTGYHDLNARFSTSSAEFEEVLPKGIFRMTGDVTVTPANEEATVESILKTECPENRYAVDAEEISFSEGYQHLDELFYVHDKDLKVRIHTEAGEGERVEIRDFTVRYLPYRTFSYHLICSLVLFAVLDLFLFILAYGRERIAALQEERGSEIIFDGIVLVAALVPLFTGLLLTNGGQDSGFHMMRIRGIADGILNGQFPVRVMPGVLWGHGYALGVYYGDVFLYPFALLYLFGIKLRNAYKTYIVAVTIATFIIGKRCFRGICEVLGCRAKKWGIPVWSVLSAVYLLGIFRLSDVYTRGALGEFTALAFLPMILYGLYAVFAGNRDRGSKGWLWLGCGMSGVILSHVISTLLLAEFGILFLFLFFKKVLKKQVLAGLGKAVLFTLLLCAGFLVPFLDLYLNLDIWGQGSGDQMVTGVRVALPQLFSLNCNPVGEAIRNGMTGEMNQGIGLAMLLPLLAALIMLRSGLFGDRTEIVKKELILATLSLFAASELFPSWWICGHFPGIYRIWSMVQFGFRYLEAAWILLMAVFIEIVASSFRSEDQRVQTAGFRLTVAVLIVTIFQAVMFLSGFMLQARSEQALNIREYKWGYEYMPEGSSPEHLRFHQEIMSSAGTLVWQQISENGLKMDVEVDNRGEEAYLLIPRIWYPGYETEDHAGQKITTEKGELAMVKVNIPAGYSGGITVNYREPWYWRVAEILSLLTLFSTVLIRKKDNPCEV